MKKVVRLFIGLSVLTMLMVCMTAVSFAGTGDDYAEVDFRAGIPGSVDYLNDDLEVTGDLVEQYFPELAEYDVADGVSFADALVAAHIDKYGEDKVKDHLAMSYNASWQAVTVEKQFDHSYTGFYYQNNTSIPVAVTGQKVADDDVLFAGSYSDYNYLDLFAHFSKDNVLMKKGDDLEMSLSVDNWGTALVPATAEFYSVNLVTLEKTKIEDAVFDKGSVKLHFADKGVYAIVADGEVEYESTDWSTMQPITVKAQYAGAICRVNVDVDPAKKFLVSFAAGMPGSYDYINELMWVRSDLVETYFPEMADYECAGTSFADAMVAAHIAKYGKDKVKENLAFGGKDWVSKQFGHTLCGIYALNGALISNGANTDAIQEYDNLYVGSYSDETYADLFYSLVEDDISTTVGKTVTIDLNVNNWGTPVAPTDVKVKLLDGETYELTDLPDAVYEDGKITVKFNETGAYRIAVEGTVTYEADYGSGPFTQVGKIMGSYAYVEVTEAKPATPKITSAKRNSKTKATVKWAKAKNAKKYEVAYKMKGAKKWTTKKTSSTKIVLKKLKAKKAYQVKVRAINGSVKSAYSKVKTIKAK